MNISQLEQGNLDGIRRQINECIDNIFRKGYEVGQDEISSTKHIEVLLENEYDKGYTDAIKEADLAITKLYTYGLARLQNEFIETSIPDIITHNSLYNIISTIKDYEEKNALQQIRVGDEVIYNEITGVVTRTNQVGEAIFLDLLFTDGAAYYDVARSEVEKTGRNFGNEVVQLLNRIGV